jgi:hypothetical protein
MSRAPRVPRELSFLPFRGSDAVAEGLLTRRMLDRPTWCRLLPDVYVHRDGYRDDDHRMWCEAVALKLPAGAAIGGLSAAYLWGVDLLPRRPANPVTVVLPGPARIRVHPRIRASPSRLARHDVTDFGGPPVTTGPRTAFDLGRQLPRTEALVAVDALLHRRVLTRAALAGYLDAHPGWPGNAQLREVLALAEPLSESPMETRLRLIVHDAGLPLPAVQHEVHTPVGTSTSTSTRTSARRFVARVDLAYPDWRIAIEYEGDHHRERARFRRDVARLDALRVAGWLVLRFTADDVLRNSGRIAQNIAAAIRERRP